MRNVMSRPGAICLMALVVVTIVFGLSLPIRFGADAPGPVAAVALAADGGVAPQGELVYVPIYSSIFYEDGKRTMQLAATLSIHNVNPDRPITITRADYYNTDGKLIKKYVDKPMVLTSLQTMNLVVERSDAAGGTGANFLVEWQAGGVVNSPLVEAVMVNASSNLGIAFTSTGRVLMRLPAAK